MLRLPRTTVDGYVTDQLRLESLYGALYFLGQSLHIKYSDTGLLN